MVDNLSGNAGESLEDAHIRADDSSEGEAQDEPVERRRTAVYQDKDKARLVYMLTENCDSDPFGNGLMKMPEVMLFSSFKKAHDEAERLIRKFGKKITYESDSIDGRTVLWSGNGFYYVIEEKEVL